MLTTSGWDIICAVRVPEVNRMLGEGFEPFDIVAVDDDRRLSAKAVGWMIVPGGSGPLLRAVLRLENGSLIRADEEPVSFTGTIHLTVQLEHVKSSDGRDAAFIREPRFDEAMLFDDLEAIFVNPHHRKVASILLRDWLDENQNRFDQVLVEASLNHLLDGCEDVLGSIKSVSFAYGDAADIQESVFAVLGRREETGNALIEQQIPAGTIAPGSSSAFVLSSTVLMEVLRSTGLQKAFPGIPDDAYDIDPDGIRLWLREPHALDVKVNVKGNDFIPSLDEFELQIEGDHIQCRSTCSIAKEGEFSASNTYKATHTIQLAGDSKAGFKIVFSPPSNVSNRKSMVVADEARENAEHWSWGMIVLGTAAVFLTDGLAAFAIGIGTTVSSSLVENAPDLEAYLAPYEAPEFGLNGIALMPSVAWGGSHVMKPASVYLDRALRIATDLA